MILHSHTIDLYCHHPSLHKKVLKIKVPVLIPPLDFTIPKGGFIHIWNIQKLLLTLACDNWIH